MVNEFCGFKHGVIGTDKMPADTTLNNMKKADLIKLLHTAQHNYENLMCFYNNAVKENMAQLNNNGWISVDDALPEETEQHSTKYDPITLAEVDVEWHTVSDLVNVIVKNYDTDEVFVCDDCTVDGKWANFGSYPFEVLEWQPMPELPAPYKKGGRR